MAVARQALEALAARLFPGATLLRCEPLGPDAAGDEKAAGYGRPVRVTVRGPDGAERCFVFRTQAANEFGHDRRADRAEASLLAYDLFGLFPDHVPALDVGAIASDGRLVSLGHAGEFWLATGWAEGTLYAEDLRRVAREGAGPLDVARCEALARYLARLHAERLDDPVAWRRAVRDLLGHGEGILGVVDAFPDGVPAAPPARLRAIEERCLAARWRLRARAERLARTHGDFHPFNIVFSPPAADPADIRFTLLDASRGGKGDPADDLVALSVNYVFFALEHAGAWRRGLGRLWRRFWDLSLEARRDPGVLESAPPYLAWRALVLSCPRFYPRLGAAARDALLGLAERVLDAGRLDPGAVEALFDGERP